jgi:hypothetical protein
MDKACAAGTRKEEEGRSEGSSVFSKEVYLSQGQRRLHFKKGRLKSQSLMGCVWRAVLDAAPHALARCGDVGGLSKQLRAKSPVAFTIRVRSLISLSIIFETLRGYKISLYIK